MGESCKRCGRKEIGVDKSGDSTAIKLDKNSQSRMDSHRPIESNKQLPSSYQLRSPERDLLSLQNIAMIKKNLRVVETRANPAHAVIIDANAEEERAPIAVVLHRRMSRHRIQGPRSPRLLIRRGPNFPNLLKLSTRLCVGRTFLLWRCCLKCRFY